MQSQSKQRRWNRGRHRFFFAFVRLPPYSRRRGTVLLSIRTRRPRCMYTVPGASYHVHMIFVPSINLLRSCLLSKDNVGILPPTSPSQPVIVDREMFFSGSIPRLFCLFSSCPFFMFVTFEPASSAHTTKAQTKLRQPQQYLHTASTAEQPAIGPAQSSKVHTAVRSCRPECDRAQASSQEEQVKVMFPFSLVVVLWLMRLYLSATNN